MPLSSTRLLFREDADLMACEARVLGHEAGGVVLDQTVFYPQGGGQPGDSGTLAGPDGALHRISTTVYGSDRTQVVHAVAPEVVAALPPGSAVRITLDADRRRALMRAHTALHLLSVVLPFPVTGGAVGEAEGRLDFDIPDARDLGLAEIEQEMNRLVALDRVVSERFITEADLDAQPELVKTMTVKPPRHGGLVRLVAIEGLDLQPCGGTHVRHTGAVGRVRIVKMEKKGRLNRRVRIELDPLP